MSRAWKSQETDQTLNVGDPAREISTCLPGTPTAFADHEISFRLGTVFFSFFILFLLSLFSIVGLTSLRWCNAAVDWSGCIQGHGFVSWAVQLCVRFPMDTFSLSLSLTHEYLFIYGWLRHSSALIATRYTMADEKFHPLVHSNGSVFCESVLRWLAFYS